MPNVIRISCIALSQLPSLPGHVAGSRGLNAIDARLVSCRKTVPAARLYRSFVLVCSQKLARQHTRGSSNSCPDLSTLQTSHYQQQQQQQQNPYGTLSIAPSYGVQIQATQPYSRSPSDYFSVRAGPHKLASAGKRVSNKARGVLGKVRTFHRAAAAKMAHPAIKVDTNVQATKRGFSEDSDDAFDALDEEEQDHDELEEGDNEGVPPFLCQPLYGEFQHNEMLS